VAKEEDEEECEMEEAEGLVTPEWGSLPVGDALRRNRDLNFIIWPPFERLHGT